MSENKTPKTDAVKQPWTLRRLWKEWGDVVVILAAVFVIFRFVLQLAWVPSGSMETTIPPSAP